MIGADHHDGTSADATLDGDTDTDATESRTQHVLQRVLARIDAPMIDSAYQLSRTGTRPRPGRERWLEPPGEECVDDARQRGRRGHDR